MTVTCIIILLLYVHFNLHSYNFFCKWKFIIILSSKVFLYLYLSSVTEIRIKHWSLYHCIYQYSENDYYYTVLIINHKSLNVRAVSLKLMTCLKRGLSKSSILMVDLLWWTDVLGCGHVNSGSVPTRPPPHYYVLNSNLLKSLYIIPVPWKYVYTFASGNLM